MENIWEKFDKNVDLELLQKDINNAKDNKREFEDVPEGNYEVKITKMELKESKNGDPMMSIHMMCMSINKCSKIYLKSAAPLFIHNY